MIVQDKCKTPTVTFNKDINGNDVIDWVMNCEDWEYYHEYLEGFDSANHPCHQYFTFSNSEIVPTFSKGEYNDATFEEYFDM